MSNPTVVSDPYASADLCNMLLYTRTSSARPNTIAPTKKLMTVNPITRRRLIPAIANTGNAQKGWTMFVTCSPIATAIAVAACDEWR